MLTHAAPPARARTSLTDGCGARACAAGTPACGALSPQVAGSPARVIGKKGRATLSSGVHVPGQTKPVFLGPVRVWPVELSTPEALKPVLREVGFLFKFVGKLWDLINAPITMD